MKLILTAWLPLLVGVLVLLRVSAALVGATPHNVVGEPEWFKKFMKSKKGIVLFVLAVAVVMTGVLVVMAWFLAYVAAIVLTILGVGTCALIAAVLAQQVSSKLAKAAIWLYVLGSAGAWALWPNWLTIDLVVVAIIVATLIVHPQTTLSFKVIAYVGAAFFLYDVVNVYLTGVMLRAAKPMMAANWPGMIIVPQGWGLSSPPAAGLGLGDVVIPGLMIMLAGVLSYRYGTKVPLYGGLIGYAVGLAAIMAVLYVARTGQPALLTLYPCVLIGILVSARKAGLSRELLAMRHEKSKHVHGRDCTCGDCPEAVTA